MSYIKGKFSKIIYQNYENNYFVALFKVKETDIDNIKGKLINVTGIMPDVKIDAIYNLNGEYLKHPKFSWQFKIDTYALEVPTTIDSIKEFLASSFVEGCGKATAEKIVKKYKEKSLEIIKNDYTSLLEIKGMTEIKAMKIYTSILNYEKDDIVINRLKELGFSLEDASKIINKHTYEIDTILEGNLYILKDLFEFKKIDDIYITNFDPYNEIRVKECILDSMKQISFNEGSTYYYEEEIYKALSVLYNINIDSNDYLNYLEDLIQDNLIIKSNKRYYLTKYYEEEKKLAHNLYMISKSKTKEIKNFDKKLRDLEKEFNIEYNDEQKETIKAGLNENITIISGGPGTGKTTIIRAITALYMKENNLNYGNVSENIALLAPTGRAAKKLSMATGLSAYTIHRFLKWHKESDTFEYNEDNKIVQKLVIVDESSMIDISLASSLIESLYYNTKIIFVGDIYQLPSVGPGLVLSDLIESDYFAFHNLNQIYRQSDNSYIPFLAKDIKMKNIDDEYMYKRDDYNFIVTSDEEIVPKIIATVKYALSKGLNEDNLQVLAPMYKGINGIDNLNIKLQEIYNPKEENKNEIKYGDKIYRENDKVLELINDSDNNVFNGDIGKIIAIYIDTKGKQKIQIDFDGKIVYFDKKDLKNITHAYAITVHKSQGSEFEHVIMPVCRQYYIMLYNKLLYTGVSRAKKSLTIIGDPRSFVTGIQNNYSAERKTSLLENLRLNFES